MESRVPIHKFSAIPLVALLRWIKYGLFFGGLLALSYCGWVMLDSYLYQTYLNRSLDRSLKQAPDRVSEKIVAPRPSIARVEGSLVGRLEVPRLGLSVMVLEGVEELTLRRGAGHIPGTAWPGASGNAGIAAHRDTYFRELKNISTGDIIRLTTDDGFYDYEVVNKKVVGPDDSDVLAATDRPMLTLVTCYPFHYIGPAPKRFIVRAQKLSTSSKDRWEDFHH